MIIFHDSRSSIYRFPRGAVACGETLRLSLRATQLKKAYLRVWWNDKETLYPMHRVSTDMYEFSLVLPENPGVLWYFFIVEGENGEIWYLGNASDGLGGIGHTSQVEPSSYQVTVYDPDYETPDWMKHGLMMQIMVDRFYCSGKPDPANLPPASYYHVHWDDDPALVVNDTKYGDNCNNDYFGGNLKGVQEKLDYIQGMGVSVIYFNPIFKARSNHKYNTGDYKQIDPSFGSEQDFKALCEAANARGIRIILDGVFSHTGSDSLYFNRDGHYSSGGAYNDPDSPYYSWYRFKSWPDEYESWWGFKTLPNVNEDDESYRNFIIRNDDSVIAHWIRAGASGWRLDVADELPMNFIRELRSRLRREKSDGAIIGEVWEDPTNKITYGETRCYCLGDTLDSAMNYPLREAVISFLCGRINADQLVRRIEHMRDTQPLPFFYAQMNLLGSHDKPRILNVLADVGNMEPDRESRRPIAMNPSDYARGKRRLIAGWELICALPGMPSLYYGDEAGLTGMSDPYCRGTYPWGNEDTELLEAMKSAMLNRAKNPVLRTGDLKLTAFGSDILFVERTIKNGLDVFGKPAKDDCQALVVNRSSEMRWVEYHGTTISIPEESAVRIKP